MIEWMIYTKIHELKNNGLKKTQVARRLNINRETVSTYWDIIYLEQMFSDKQKIKKNTGPVLPEKYRGNHVEVRDLSVYENAMERSAANG